MLLFGCCWCAASVFCCLGALLLLVLFVCVASVVGCMVAGVAVCCCCCLCVLLLLLLFVFVAIAVGCVFVVVGVCVCC